MAQSPFTNQCCFQNLPLDWDIPKDAKPLSVWNNCKYFSAKWCSQPCPQHEVLGLYLKQWDGCELPGVRIHLLIEVYSESWSSQTEASQVLGEGNFFKCVVPGDTALLFTGADGFYALKGLQLEQKGEVVNVNRGKK